MLKKVAAVTLGAIVAIYVLSHTTAGSYVSTAWKQMRREAGQQVSVQFELERLKGEVGRLEPDINRNRSLVAQEKVAVDNLRDEIKNLQAKLDQSKADIRRVSTELKNGATAVTFDGRDLSADRATSRLDAMIDSAERSERVIASKNRVLASREKKLEANMKNLFAMRDEKTKLEEQISELEAAYSEIQLQQTQCKHQFDDSRMANIKQSLENLRNRVKVEKAEVDLQNDLGGSTIEKPKANGDVLRRADRLLGDDKVVEK
jgi:chromosome segregation ATPase